jgi:catalase
MEGRAVHAEKTFLTASSVLYDALAVAGGESAAELARIPDALRFLREAFRHAKPIGATNEGIDVLEAAALPGVETAAEDHGEGVVASVGVVTQRAEDLSSFGEAFVEAVREHRHFDRELDVVPA